MCLLWLARIASFVGFCLLTIGAVFPEWERSPTGETIGLWQECLSSNNELGANSTESNDGSGENAVENEDNEDVDPEPGPEPECTYKTSSLMSEERWLLACSTIGCVFTGAASILLCLPKKSLYFVSADLQITGALLYLVTVGVWMNDTSLASGGEKQRCIKTIGWALAVGLSGIAVGFLNGILSRFVACKSSNTKYDPTDETSNPYNDGENETNTDLTSM